MSPAAQKPWLTPEDNTWWSATGKTTDGKAFTNALALVMGTPAQFAVITGPNAIQPVPLANVTAATRMAIVDADWVERAGTLSGKITDAERRLSGIQSICSGYSRNTMHPDAVAVLEMIDPLVTPSKDGVL